MLDSRAAEFHPAGGGAEMLLHGVARQRFDAGMPGVITQRLDLLLVETFRDQLRFGLVDDLVEAVIAIPDVARAALDAEFFGGNAKNLSLCALARGDDADVMRDRGRDRRQQRWRDKQGDSHVHQLVCLRLPCGGVNAIDRVALATGDRVMGGWRGDR